jgi:hypothetical protein
MTAEVVGILKQLGIINPPAWLVWALLAAGSVALIISILSGFGLITVPAWAAYAILGAKTFSL